MSTRSLKVTINLSVDEYGMVNKAASDKFLPVAVFIRQAALIATKNSRSVSK